MIARRQDTPPKSTEISYQLRLVTSEPHWRIDLLHRQDRKNCRTETGEDDCADTDGISLDGAGLAGCDGTCRARGPR